MKITLKPSKELIKLAGSVLLAQAWEATIRPTIEKIQLDILKEKQYINVFYKEDKMNKIITDLKLTYLMSDEDFKEFYKIFYDQATAKGFDFKYDTCPLLIAENLTSKAIRAMLEEAQKITNISPDDALCSKNGLDNYEKLTNLTLSLCVPFLNKDEILKGIEPKKKGLQL